VIVPIVTVDTPSRQGSSRASGDSDGRQEGEDRSSMRSRCRISSISAPAVLALFVWSVSTGALAAERANATSAPESRLQAIVSRLKSRLEITAPIVVKIVPSNALMMSVEAPTDTRNTFLLSVEASFLDALTDEELEAGVAHELGHVWIFTHHPFLQTEELANQIAMRAVKRESLERVYAKVWDRGGTKGDLARFLGAGSPTSAAGLGGDSSR
jgi:hypothetical protein